MALEASQGITAVVLAAGLSRRMGEPKLLLPWAGHTVIEQVVSTLQQAGVHEIVVVTGGYHDQIADILSSWPVTVVYNPDFAQTEMLVSFQVGVRALPTTATACLLALGDQPLLEASIVKAICSVYAYSDAPLVIPSYHMRRGHPWLVDRALWPALLEMTADQSLRDFLRLYESQITYVRVDSPSILKDMDTPEDYQSQRPDHE